MLWFYHYNPVFLLDVITSMNDMLQDHYILILFPLKLIRYTAASELLPLLAVGSTPLLKVEQICQAIDAANRTIENSATLASPLATCSFNATATFEIRTPSRIQVLEVLTIILFGKAAYIWMSPDPA